MTVTSMLWPTNGVGDGTVTGYTDAQTQRLFRLVGGLAGRTATHGVFYGEGDNLAVSYDSPSNLSVGTGAALIYGIPVFVDTTPESLVLSGVAADTGGVVYVAVVWATQTAVVSYRQSTSGDTSIPALTQTANTRWEIPLAEYVVNSSGVATVTDARGWVNLMQKREMIAVTGNESGGDPLLVSLSTFGPRMDGAVVSNAVGSWITPPNFIEDLPCEFAAVWMGTTTGDVEIYLSVLYQGSIETLIEVTTVTDTYELLRTNVLDMQGFLIADDYSGVGFVRNTDFDTAGQILVMGVEVRYWVQI